MQEKDKKYILENIHKKSTKEISKELGLKERKIKKFLETEETRKQIEASLQNSEDSVIESSAQKHNLLIIFTLFLSGLVIYSNTFFSSFHLDDLPSIVYNSSIRNIHDLHNIWNFWPTRFIAYLSLAFNYHFHHLDVFGYHLFNLAVHLGLGILVWWFSLLTFSTPIMKDQKIARHANLVSFFAALIFVTHPIQTQAVTYIVQRTASLATFFYLGSLTLYVKSRLLEDKKSTSGFRRLYYSGSLVLAVMAMFTKEMTITLPLMICLYEFCFFKTNGNFNWKRFVPFLFCLSIIPLTMLFTKTLNLEQMQRVGEDALTISPWSYFLTQFRVLVTYVRLLLLPLNQNFNYDYPVANTLLDLSVLMSLFLLAGIFIVAVKLFRNYRLVSFGIFWFFLSLLPESTIIPINDVIYEHRLYLSMAGYSLFLISSLYYLFEKNDLKRMVMIMLTVVIFYSTLTYARNAVWRDEITLWNDAIHKSPHKARSYNNRGLAYLINGNFVQALSDFSEAIEIEPNSTTAYGNRGIVYQSMGNFDQAISDYIKAIETKPEHADAYSKLYSYLGSAYAGKGNFDQAISNYNKAINIKPDSIDAYNNRAVAYFEKQEYDKSWEDVYKAEALGYMIKPDFLEALKKASGREK